MRASLLSASERIKSRIQTKGARTQTDRNSEAKSSADESEGSSITADLTSSQFSQAQTPPSVSRPKVQKPSERSSERSERDGYQSVVSDVTWQEQEVASSAGRRSPLSPNPLLLSPPPSATTSSSLYHNRYSTEQTPKTGNMSNKLVANSSPTTNFTKSSTLSSSPPSRPQHHFQNKRASMSSVVSELTWNDPLPEEPSDESTSSRGRPVTRKQDSGFLSLSSPPPKTTTILGKLGRRKDVSEVDYLASRGRDGYRATYRNREMSPKQPQRQQSLDESISSIVSELTWMELENATLGRPPPTAPSSLSPPRPRPKSPKQTRSMSPKARSRSPVRNTTTTTSEEGPSGSNNSASHHKPPPKSSFHDSGVSEMTLDWWQSEGSLKISDLMRSSIREVANESSGTPSHSDGSKEALGGSNSVLLVSKEQQQQQQQQQEVISDVSNSDRNRTTPPKKNTKSAEVKKIEVLSLDELVRNEIDAMPRMPMRKLSTSSGDRLAVSERLLLDQTSTSGRDDDDLFVVSERVGHLDKTSEHSAASINILTTTPKKASKSNKKASKNKNKDTKSEAKDKETTALPQHSEEHSEESAFEMGEKPKANELSQHSTNSAFDLGEKPRTAKKKGTKIKSSSDAKSIKSSTSRKTKKKSKKLDESEHSKVSVLDKNNLKSKKKSKKLDDSVHSKDSVLEQLQKPKKKSKKLDDSMHSKDSVSEHLRKPKKKSKKLDDSVHSKDSVLDNLKPKKKAKKKKSKDSDRSKLDDSEHTSQLEYVEREYDIPLKKSPPKKKKKKKLDASERTNGTIDSEMTLKTKITKKLDVSERSFMGTSERTLESNASTLGELPDFKEIGVPFLRGEVDGSNHLTNSAFEVGHSDHGQQKRPRRRSSVGLYAESDSGHYSDNDSGRSVRSCLEMGSTRSIPKPSALADQPARPAFRPKVSTKRERRKSVTFADGEQARPLMPVAKKEVSRDWGEASVDRLPSPSLSARMSPPSLPRRVAPRGRRDSMDVHSAPRSRAVLSSEPLAPSGPSEGVNFLLDRITAIVPDSPSAGLTRSNDVAPMMPRQRRSEDSQQPLLSTDTINEILAPPEPDLGTPKMSGSGKSLATSVLGTPELSASRKTQATPVLCTPKLSARDKLGLKLKSPSMLVTPTRVIGEREMQERRKASSIRKGAVFEAMDKMLIDEASAEE